VACVPHDTKIAIAVRADLATWQKLNVTAYLASALAAGREGVIGEPYEDASGHGYLAMFGLPVLVFGATAEQLELVRRRCADRQLAVGIFTDELFSTDNDAANRAAVRAVAADKLTLAGLAVHDRRSTVDKVLKGLRLHP
jgi:hypothetical protein